MSASARARNAAPPGMLRVEVGERGVQQGQPFADAAPRQPQRLQRGRERNASSGSQCSRLHENAARRLSISSSACGETALIVSRPGASSTAAIAV